LLPLAWVWLPAYALAYPLPNVPAQMQDEISDAIRLVIGTIPKLFVREVAEATFDFCLVLAQILGGLA
jgi:hypothetical protein